MPTLNGVSSSKSVQLTPLSTHWAPRKKNKKKGTIFFGHGVCNVHGQIINLFNDESENLERIRRLGDLSIDGRKKHYHALLTVIDVLSRLKVTFPSPVVSVRRTCCNTKHYDMCTHVHCPYVLDIFVTTVIILLNNIKESVGLSNTGTIFTL
jgi:hypothetical protein